MTALIVALSLWSRVARIVRISGLRRFDGCALGRCLGGVIEPLSAIAIGLVAGILHNLAGDLLEKLLIDDAVGAIPIHGVGGVWGTLAVALYVSEYCC